MVCPQPAHSGARGASGNNTGSSSNAAGGVTQGTSPAVPQNGQNANNGSGPGSTIGGGQSGAPQASRTGGSGSGTQGGGNNGGSR